MSVRKQITDSLPEPERIRRIMHGAAPQFMRCPNGHTLPHRVVWGRCSPVDCVDKNEPGTRRKNRDSEDATAPYAAEMALLPRGEEAAALQDYGSMEEAEEAKAYSEESLVMMRYAGIARAREAFYPMPEIPAPVQRQGESTQEYLKRRADEAAKYALELKIFNLKYGTPERRDAVAEELLNYNGLNRKNELPGNTTPPILVMIGTNPYMKGAQNVVGQPDPSSGSGSAVPAVVAGQLAAWGRLAQGEPAVGGDEREGRERGDGSAEQPAGGEGGVAPGVDVQGERVQGGE